MGRAIAVTKVGREKMLVLGVVRELLEKHHNEQLLVCDGEVQGWHRFEADKPDLETSLKYLHLMDERPTRARLYNFKGRYVLSDECLHKVEINCVVFVDDKRPRAARASLVIPGGPFWYDFIHTKHESPDGPRVHRNIVEDLFSPGLYSVERCLMAGTKAIYR